MVRVTVARAMALRSHQLTPCCGGFRDGGPRSGGAWERLPFVGFGRCRRRGSCSVAWCQRLGCGAGRVLGGAHHDPDAG